MYWASLRWRANFIECHPRSLTIELKKEKMDGRHWWSFVVAVWWRKLFIQYRREGS